MIVLVGANGFLGRHVSELLERKAIPAVAVSRLPDHAFFERFAPSIRVIASSDFASSVGRDVLANASALVYFAWQSIPSTFAQQPWRELSENVDPALQCFLRVAELSPQAKIVFLSSGGTVYGSEGTTPKNENAVTHPISAYGLGKLMTEEALRFVGRTRGTRYSILRPSNPVGRWQAKNVSQGIVSVAMRAVHERVPIQLFGGGKQVRDFVDADDVAEAIYAAAADGTHVDATWNVGSGRGIAITDMVDHITRVIGQKIPVEHAPARASDVAHVVLDCRRITKELGWAPRAPIEQSISGLWDMICEHYGSGARHGLR